MVVMVMMNGCHGDGVCHDGSDRAQMVLMVVMVVMVMMMVVFYLS